MSVLTRRDRPQNTSSQISPRHWSLVARLAAWYAISAFALVALAMGALYWALTLHFVSEQDAYLTDQVHILRDHLSHAPDLAVKLKTEIIDENALRHAIIIYVRILDEDGRLLIETPGMQDILPKTFFPNVTGDLVRPVIGKEITHRAGNSFRIVAESAAIAGRGIGTIQIASGNLYEKELLAHYRRWLVTLLTITLMISLLGGYLLARRGLSPIRAFATVIGGIDSASLAARVPISRLPDELVELAESFNKTLARLEDAFARLRQFSADIAHELRTPVNNLHGIAEVALCRERSPEEYREVLVSSLEECQRLSRLIDSLLFLARAGHPQTTLAREPCDLTAELLTLQSFYAPAADEAGIELIHRGQQAPLMILGDRTLIQRALANLIENALSHAHAANQIVIAAVRDRGRIQVSVSDNGCGIPMAHLSYIFERFHRVTHARSHSREHVGLGLSIVRSIAVLHGGCAEVVSLEGYGTTVTLMLPDDGMVMNTTVIHG